MEPRTERIRRGAGRFQVTGGAALAVLVALAGAAPAFGQHALDRNLQVGSGGINPQGQDIGAEMRFRNAIVTGNAPGGLSFRGDVGYFAPGEFTGRAGANDTFSFRRDSIYSGLGGLGIRGTDALQYQFARTTGMAPPPGMIGAPSAVPRAMSGPTGGMLRTEPLDLRNEGVVGTVPPLMSPGDTAGDARGLAVAGLRTPSAFVTGRTFEPTMLGVVAGPDGVPLGVTASVLRGVTYGPVTAGRELDRTQPGPLPPEIGARRPGVSDDPLERRLDSGVGRPLTPYDELMERIRRAPDERMDPEMVEDPAGVGLAARDARDAREARARGNLTDLRLQLQQPTRTPSQRTTQRLDQRYEPRQPGLDPVDMGTEPRDIGPETVEMLRRAGQMDVLAAPGFDAYATHMQAAQRHLAAGRYFDAEDRFTAALSARPRDPMAAVGRIHAALGAGMYLSATVNLRDVLVTNPELIGVRYGKELLPSPDQMETAKGRLVELIRVRPVQAREAGMLLAYLGYQTGDERAISRGLAAMEAPAGEEPLTPADEQMMRLADVMRRVWEDREQPGERPPE